MLLPSVLSKTKEINFMMTWRQCPKMSTSLMWSKSEYYKTWTNLRKTLKNQYDYFGQLWTLQYLITTKSDVVGEREGNQVPAQMYTYSLVSSLWRWGASFICPFYCVWDQETEGCLLTLWKVSLCRGHTINHHCRWPNFSLIHSPKNWEKTKPGAQCIKMGDFMCACMYVGRETTSK